MLVFRGETEVEADEEEGRRIIRMSNHIYHNRKHNKGMPHTRWLTLVAYVSEKVDQELLWRIAWKNVLKLRIGDCGFISSLIGVEAEDGEGDEDYDENNPHEPEDSNSKGISRHS